MARTAPRCHVELRRESLSAGQCKNGLGGKKAATAQGALRRECDLPGEPKDHLTTRNSTLRSLAITAAEAPSVACKSPSDLVLMRAGLMPRVTR